MNRVGPVAQGPADGRRDAAGGDHQPERNGPADCARRVAEGTLLGTVTDGDIRKGLLRGLGSSGSISEIMCRDPLVVPPQMGRDTVIQLMQANRIHQVPVVDGRPARRRPAGPGRSDDAESPAAQSDGDHGGRAGRQAEAADGQLPQAAPAGRRQTDARAHHRARQARGIRALRAGRPFSRQDDRGLLRRRQRAGTSASTTFARNLRSARPAPSVCSIRVPRPRCSSPTAMCLPTSATASSSTSTPGMARRRRWRCGCTSGSTRSASSTSNGVDIIGFEEKPVARSHINAGVYVLEPARARLLSPG